MNSKRRLFPQALPHHIELAALLGLALIARMLWLAYTNFTEEDAFIVFRFARNLAAGSGFVFNAGERVYGSTTPLYTFGLAVWRWLTGEDFILGARLFCVGASIAGLALLAVILRRMRIPLAWRLALIGWLGISTKACLMDTQGLETPFVILLMMASWLLWNSKKPGWAGLCAGLLLWVRIDTVLWPVALAIASCFSDFRRGVKLLAVAGLTYLPWTIIAWQYFGSPVPLTVLAKWAAAGTAPASAQVHLGLIVGYLSPLDFGPFGIAAPDLLPALTAGFFTLLFAAWGGIFSLKRQWLLPPFIFILMEFIRLADTRAAIDNRYYYPLLWCVWILFLIGMLTVWKKTQQRGPRSAWIPRILAFIAATAILLRGCHAAGIVRDYQVYRNESLKEVGLWLKANSPPQAAVLLEPLGYIGYYSDRRLVDDVGLVTPDAVALGLQGVPRHEYYKYFDAAFYVSHCSFPESQRTEPGAEADFLSRYRIVARMDPLAYHPAVPSREPEDILPWVACYIIWQR
jgi:arabinofuranosyltransferase